MVVPTIMPRPTCPTILKTPFEPLFVVAEDFDVVVQKADQPQPDRRNQHQLDIDVVELSEKQYGDENGQQDDYAAHRGRAFLLELSFEPQIADLLTDLFAAQEVDDVASEDDDDQQGDDDGCRARNEMYWNIPAPGRL